MVAVCVNKRKSYAFPFETDAPSPEAGPDFIA